MFIELTGTGYSHDTPAAVDPTRIISMIQHQGYTRIVLHAGHEPFNLNVKETRDEILDQIRRLNMTHAELKAREETEREEAREKRARLYAMMNEGLPKERGPGHVAEETRTENTSRVRSIIEEA